MDESDVGMQQGPRRGFVDLSAEREAREVGARAAMEGERRVAEIARYVEANELEIETMARFEELVRHGYKFIDLHVRKDGKEYRFEADWLARLFRKQASP